jgi:hypothetical protein
MSLLYRAGAFLFYFGIVSAILAIFFIGVFSAYAYAQGLRIPDVIYSMAKIFVLSSVIGGLGGLLTGRVIGAFLPGVSQAIGISFILTYFLPIYTSVCGVINTLIYYLPIDNTVKIALASTVYTFSAFALMFYIGVKVGALPVM